MHEIGEHGVAGPVDTDVLRVLGSAATEPQSAVLSEMNCPVRFAW